MQTLTLHHEDSGVVTVYDDDEDVILHWRAGPVTIGWPGGKQEVKMIDDSVYLSIAHVPALILWL